MFTIKISSNILRDLLNECEKSGEEYGVLNVAPTAFYMKDNCDEEKFSPVISLTLDSNGEIATKIKAKYNSGDDGAAAPDIEAEKENEEYIRECSKRIHEMFERFKADLQKL